MTDSFINWLLYIYFVVGATGGWLVLIVFFTMMKASYKRIKEARKEEQHPTGV